MNVLFSKLLRLRYPISGEIAARGWARWLEYALLFFVLPVHYSFHREDSPLIFLGFLSILAMTMLLRNPRFPKEVLVNCRGWRLDLKRELLCFLTVGTALTLLVAWITPQFLFYCPRHHFTVWLSLMIVYPLFSVYPQELIYRAFLWHRYRFLAGGDQGFMHLSAVAFGFGHIIYFHPLSMLMSLAGGYVFAWTYLKTRSLLAVTFEHALYGCMLYTVGLGRYFYTGFETLAG